MPTPCPLRMIYGPNVLSPTLDDAIIPLTGKYKLTGKVVYAEDDVHYLYTEYTLMFDLVIYPEVSTGGSDMEAEATRIRNILSTPGLQLSIYPLGLGQFNVINVDQFDLRGGPFPQDIEVEPFVANRSIAIRGSIMFRVSPCITNGGSYEIPPSHTQVVQNVVEQDVSVNEDGIVEFTLHYTFQFASPFNSPISKPLLDLAISPLNRIVNRQFQGMKKKVRTSISKDGRIYRIRVVYTEHESDSAFHPYTKNITFDDTLESSIMGGKKGEGFYKWTRTTDCTIKLPPRVHKAWAWYVYKRILQERFKNLKILDKTIGANVFTKADEQPVDALDTKPWYIPLRIRITNSLYDRTLKLYGTYMVVCSLSEIISCSKILDPVDAYVVDASPGGLDDQWFAWQQTQGDVSVKGFLQYNTDGIPVDLNQCTNTTAETALIYPTLEIPEEETTPPNSQNPPEPATNEHDETARIPHKPAGSLVPIPAEQSWLDYKNNVELIEDGSIVPISYLEKPSSGSGRGYYEAGNTGSTTSRAYNGTVINNRTSGASQSHPVTTIERGHSVFYARMKGYALRYGYKPSAPYIVEIAGKTVKRLKQRVEVSTVSNGEHPLYLAKWDILYVVEGGDPYSGDLYGGIKTTGSPTRYS